MGAVINVAFHSERGRRPTNQDMIGLPVGLTAAAPGRRACLFNPPDPALLRWKGYLFLLADGVGGVAGGEQASALAVEEAGRRYYADPSDDLGLSLQRVIEAANRRLRDHRRAHDELAGMATTLAALVVQGRRLYVANVGDSRAYLIRRGEALLLTADHNRAQHAPDAPSASQAAGQRITRSLGSRPQVGTDLWQWELQPGDRLLLCSDGLSSHLDAPALARLAELTDLSAAVRALIDTAYDNGSQDNISVILVEPVAGRHGSGR